MGRVLIIDPSHDVRVLLREALEGDGFVVLTSGTGAEALALLQQERKVSVIILEPDLPIMGVEQFLAIKAQDVELSPVPVVLMGQFDRSLRALGVTEFIGKPFDLEQLLTILRKY